MKFAAVFVNRFRWLNLPGAVLLALLQRTPALRMAVNAEEMIASSPVAAVVRALGASVASLGAVHALAGATQFTITRNPVTGTVGTAISAVAFTVTGAQTPAGSYKLVAGSLPPGLTIPGMNTSTLILNATSGQITGTPTTAGSFSISVRAYEFANGQGDTFPPSPFVINFAISGGAAVAPTITTQPASQTVNAGGSVTFTVAATGTAPLAYQWKKDGGNIGGATNASLALTNVQAGDAGNYTVQVSNGTGSATSNAATLAVNAAAAVPQITAGPVSQTIASGGTVAFSVTASGATAYKWMRDGVEIAGATSATLVLSGAAASAGNYAAIASNAAGASQPSTAAALTVVSTTDVGRLTNLSIRTNAGTGDQTLIVGFAIGGQGNKPLLLRGVGPSLSTFGVTGVLADPVETVFNSGSVAMATNNNWGGDSTIKARAAAVGAFPLASDTSLDSALAITPPVGSYTVQITGNNSGTGVALAEIYDASSTFDPTTPRLVNVSARTQVGTGDGILITGFGISGTTSRTVLIRAIGPTLTQFGVSGALADPKLQLYSGSTMVRENDDWGGDGQLTAIGTSVGAFGLSNGSSKDAMLLVTLAPGTYTAQVSGVGSTTGVALVEVYEVP